MTTAAVRLFLGRGEIITGMSTGSPVQEGVRAQTEEDSAPEGGFVSPPLPFHLLLVNVLLGMVVTAAVFIAHLQR
jgi:hypothetical protein